MSEVEKTVTVFRRGEDNPPLVFAYYSRKLAFDNGVPVSLPSGYYYAGRKHTYRLMFADDKDTQESKPIWIAMVCCGENGKLYYCTIESQLHAHYAQFSFGRYSFDIKEEGSINDGEVNKTRRRASGKQFRL